MSILRKHLLKILFISAILFVFTGNSYAQTVYDWTGTVSNNWSTPGNWNVGGVAQTTNYPGLGGGTTDVVQIGVTNSFTSTSTTHPILATTDAVTVASVTLGDNFPASGVQNVTYCEIDGTLNITGTFLQNHSSVTGFKGLGGSTPGFSSGYYYPLQVYLFGTGNLSCTTFQVGDNTLPAATGITNVVRFKMGSELNTAGQGIKINITGNLIANSVTNGASFAPPTESVSHSNLSFAAGTLTIAGQILLQTTGTVNYVAGTYPTWQPIAWFTIDTYPNGDAVTLNLTGANALNVTNTAASNVFDFVNYHAGTGTAGTSNVNYSANGSQEIYAVYSPAFATHTQFETNGGYYQNLTLSGSGTKTFDSNGPTLTETISGNLSLQGSVTADLGTNNPKFTLTGAYASVAGTTLTKTGASQVTFSTTTNNGGTLTFTGAAAMKFTGAITNSGTMNFGQTASTVTISNSLTNTGSIYETGTAPITVAGVTNNNAGTYYQQSSGTLKFTGLYTSVAGATLFQTGSGPVNYAAGCSNAGSLTQTGTVGAVTITGALTNSGTITQAGGTYSVSGTVLNSGNLNLGSANFSMAGDYTNSANFTAGTGTAIFNGASTQNLAGGAGAGTAFNNVTFSGGSNKIMNSGNFSVSPVSVMTLSGTNTIVTTGGGNLTMLSTSSGTGTIAAITNGCKVNGANVTSQRYLTGNRGYRLIASPVNASSNTVDGNGNLNYSLNYVKASAYITGTPAGGTAGFDNTAAANPTLYLYREDVPVSNASFISGNYRGVNNISASAPPYSLDNEGSPYNIPVSNGFLFFFRGNRADGTFGQETVTTWPATTATLSTTGSLNQGQITFRDWYTASSAILGYSNPNIIAQGYNLAANPYPSTIDWETFNTSSSTTGIYTQNVSSYVYELNPLTKNYDEYEAGVGGTVYTNSGSRYIASGQGFFVLAIGSGAQLVFNESAKTSALIPSANLLMGAPVASNIAQSLKLELAKDSLNKDNIVILFNDNAKTGYVFNEDASYKIGTGLESLTSLSSDNVPLAINKLPLSKDLSIPLRVNVSANGNYNFNMKSIQGIPQVYDVWLVDAKLKDSVNMRSVATYSFTVNKSDSTTFGAKRFKLVMHEDPALAYRLISFGGSKIDNQTAVQLVWKAKNEENYTHFTVERSNDAGKTFDVVGGMLSASQSTYSLMDKNPLPGLNQYRLKQEDYFNTITYSNLVGVIYSDKTLAITNLNIYPNPAVSNISLTIIPKTTAQTTYNIRISNSTGQMVKTAVVTEPFWQGNVSSLLTGTYLLQVTDSKDSSVIGQTKFVKL